jgi:hypothetical protein
VGVPIAAAQGCEVKQYYDKTPIIAGNRFGQGVVKS